MPFANNAVPTGWLAANGAELLKTTYATLFAAIGTTYGETNGAGGAGTTHFRAPDLRGTFVRGFDGTRGLDSGRTFGSYQADSFGSHNHGFSDYYQTSTTTYTTADKTRTDGGANRVTSVSTAEGAGWAANATDSRGDTETRPKNIAMLYCIKF
jgi:microcystin-dependent protein